MTGDTLAQFSLHGMPLEAWSSNAVLLQAVLQDGGVPQRPRLWADAAWTRADVQPRSRAFPPLNPRVWKALESPWLGQGLSGL